MGAASSVPGQSSTGHIIFSYAMRGIVLSIIIIIIMVIVHFTIKPVFSFSPADLGFIQIPVPSDRQVAFNKAFAGLDVSANFVDIVPCGYTLSMDLYLTGAFATSTAPRVILYNSPTPIQGISFTKDTIGTAFPNSNLIMWLDPAVNDLYISTVTSAPGALKRIETTPPISNVPIKTPFRVTYVYTQGFLEVYLNGSLQTTMVYKNPPIGSSELNPFFFGQISSLASCRVGNVFYWGRPLTSREVRAAGSPVSTTAFFSAIV